MAGTFLLLGVRPQTAPKAHLLNQGNLFSGSSEGLWLGMASRPFGFLVVVYSFVLIEWEVPANVPFVTPY